MPLIDTKRTPEPSTRSIQIIHSQQLVTTQRERVSAPRIQMRRSSETRQSLPMIFLQREAIARRDPRLGGRIVYRHEFLREVRQRDFLLKMPQDSGIDVHIPHPVRVQITSLLERSSGLCPPRSALVFMGSEHGYGPARNPLVPISLDPPSRSPTGPSFVHPVSHG